VIVLECIFLEGLISSSSVDRMYKEAPVECDSLVTKYLDHLQTALESQELGPSVNGCLKLLGHFVHCSPFTKEWQNTLLCCELMGHYCDQAMELTPV
jgi:hypothetical protein